MRGQRGGAVAWRRRRGKVSEARLSLCKAPKCQGEKGFAARAIAPAAAAALETDRAPSAARPSVPARPSVLAALRGSPTLAAVPASVVSAARSALSRQRVLGWQRAGLKRGARCGGASGVQGGTAELWDGARAGAGPGWVCSMPARYGAARGPPASRRRRRFSCCGAAAAPVIVAALMSCEY